MNAAAKIMVTGAKGRLGRYFQRVLGGQPGFVPAARSDAPANGIAFDLEDAAATAAAVAAVKPEIVIHAAAVTDVDRCEKEPEFARRGNVETTQNLVAAIASKCPAARLIYLSTDQVYFGPGPSREDAASPRTAYARTKMQGEGLALRSPGALVVRLNFVGVGDGIRPTLGEWIAASLCEGRAMTLFEDVLFNPAYAGDVPSQVLALAAAGATGVVNLGCASAGLSKADFARGLAQRLNLSLASARSGKLGDVSLAAQRPLDTRMDVGLAESMLRTVMPTPDAVMDKFAADWRQREAIAA